MSQLLLSSERYRALAQKTHLNGLLRDVFGEIKSAEECRNLLVRVDTIRAEIITIQGEVMRQVVENEMLKSQPLRLIRDSQSNLAIPYLRWRDYLTMRGGKNAFQQYLQNNSVPKPIYDLLMTVERSRTILNMQAGIVANILNQLRKTEEDMIQVENLVVVTPDLVS